VNVDLLFSSFNVRRMIFRHLLRLSMQCSDDLFGLNAAPQDRKIMTRIPAKLFRDFEPGGGLCFILTAAIKYKMAHRAFSFEKDLIKADRASVSSCTFR
jgi:hypothetical protein